MKNTILSLLFTFAFSLLANAHPPKKINATYDASKQSVILDIIHSVKDPESHYIDEVVITIGEEKIEKDYTGQSSTKSQDVEIKLNQAPAKGTTISIFAECNKFGSKTVEIVVE